MLSAGSKNELVIKLFRVKPQRISADVSSFFFFEHIRAEQKTFLYRPRELNQKASHLFGQHVTKFKRAAAAQTTGLMSPRSLLAIAFSLTPRLRIRR